MKTYKVKFKIKNTTSQRRMRLHGGTESEAIAKLKQQGGRRDSDIIILSIEPV